MNNYKESMRKTGPLAGTHPTMALGSALLVMAFVAFTVIDPEYAGAVYSSTKNFIASGFSWYYILLISFTLFFYLDHL